MENLIEKINKKSAQVAKLQKRLNELLKDCSKEEYEAIIFFVETGDRSLYKAYLKSHNLNYGGDAWSKANDYYDANNTLDKYHKLLASEEAKQATLNEIPQAIKTFGENLFNRWNEYDMWKKQAIREEMKKEPKGIGSDYREFQYKMREKWGRDYYQFAYYTSEEQIIKTNRKAVDTLILNLINRTIEITGKITDAQYLRLDQDNQGYSIINGIIIGETGKARIESIGAGGYNIQRYHIRVLVKPIKS